MTYNVICMADRSYFTLVAMADYNWVLTSPEFTLCCVQSASSYATVVATERPTSGI